MEQSEFLGYLVEVFDRLELGYFVVGSIATSYYGEPRFTNDIDVIVELNALDIRVFCQAFPMEEFYISEEAVRHAVADKRQFNILHPTSGLKADLFVLGDTPFEKSRFSRRQELPLEDGRSVWFARPEDVILKKMVYYEEGKSEKHIRDILGVLKVQGESIELSYITLWANRLGLGELWQHVNALRKTGASEGDVK